MKFKKEISTFYYKAEEKALKDFYELKCNIAEKIEGENITIRRNLFPENVSSIFAFYDNGHIIFQIWFDTEFGGYLLPTTICLHEGGITLEFNSIVYLGANNDDGYIEKHLNDKQFNKVIDFCIPLIAIFLNNLLKIEKNHPCTDDCTFYNYKIKNSECDKMFISKKEIASKKGKK